MKRSTFAFLLIFALLGVGILFYAPVRTKIRGKLSRIWSKNAVALKTNQEVTEAAYAWPLVNLGSVSSTFEKERGNVVFLNFWATWCAPCIKEIPDIQKLYDQYGGRVSFLLVTQEDTATVRKFFRKKNFTVPMYLTKKEEIPSVFYASTIPTTYIIGHTGQIKLAKSGSIDVESDSIKTILNTLILKTSR